VVEDAVDLEGGAVVQVENARLALAQLASAFYGNPANRLRLIGVTGTNGKTTTAMLIQEALSAGGSVCGYLGTLGVHAANEQRQLSNTTPEAPALQAELKRLADANHDTAVLEVSSHGLALDRVAGLRFAVAVFTNLTRDHLDFHRTEERYLNAKARLFEELDEGAVAVLNADDPASAALAARCPAPKLSYGRCADADIRIQSAHPLSHGTDIALVTPAGTLRLRSRLQGAFNVSNIAAASACATALGLPLDAVREGIEGMGRVPGRFEPVDAGQAFRVLVDYAHTPAGLDSVLRAAAEITTGRVLCVFGCGGDRDPGKRPLMGRVVERLADIAYVTSDNPRSEDPGSIIAAIVAGMENPDAAVVASDRRQAIASALQDARPDDTVVIAGKGHEGGQIIGDRTLPFSDTQVAVELLGTPQLVDEGTP
jgi:UDP-N-acetylmuramoyl-L-alanyl-D-glutamate--2,6-diaminopimelate ligase